MKFAKATKFHRKSGGGTAETGEHGFSRPSGTRYLSLNTTQDCVLGYFQVAPTGLELQIRVLTQTLKPNSLSLLYGPTKVVP